MPAFVLGWGSQSLLRYTLGYFVGLLVPYSLTQCVCEGCLGHLGLGFSVHWALCLLLLRGRLPCVHTL